MVSLAEHCSTLCGGGLGLGGYCSETHSLSRLSRNPDDQEAVTTAALLLAPGRTRDLHLSGIKLNMMHNGLIDGKRQVTPAQYIKWWQYFSERDFPNGREKCSKYIVAGGRLMM